MNFSPINIIIIQLSFEAAHSAIEPRVMRLFLHLFASYALNHIQYRVKRESYLLFYAMLYKRFVHNINTVIKIKSENVIGIERFLQTSLTDEYIGSYPNNRIKVKY